MIVNVDGVDIHCSTGGVDLTGDDPVIVLVHGAGMDSTVWQLQTRYLAYRGYRPVAIDLPGHGSSGGEPIDDVAEMGQWLGRFVEALAWGPVAVVGHSMGTFIALELAAARPDLVSALVLMGTSTAMPVHPELLDNAANDVPAAAALMAGWGHDNPARIGLNPTPGMWMTGGQRALVERSAPGSLANDLAACAAYDGAETAASKVTAPTTVIIGLGDKMTAPKGGRALAAAIPGAEVVELADTGHSMMFENPRAVRNAIIEATRDA